MVLDSTLICYLEYPFTAIPRWTMNNKYLNVAPSIKYLGTSLCHDNGASHTELRKLAAQKAYYSLQGAGLKYNGVKLDTAIKI